jgi:hypothetical protein
MNRTQDPNHVPADSEASEVRDSLLFDMILDDPEEEMDWVAERQRREQANLESDLDADLWFMLPDDD